MHFASSSEYLCCSWEVMLSRTIPPLIRSMTMNSCEHQSTGGNESSASANLDSKMRRITHLTLDLVTKNSSMHATCLLCTMLASSTSLNMASLVHEPKFVSRGPFNKERILHGIVTLRRLPGHTLYTQFCFPAWQFHYLACKLLSSHFMSCKPNNGKPCNKVRNPPRIHPKLVHSGLTFGHHNKLLISWPCQGSRLTSNSNNFTKTVFGRDRFPTVLRPATSKQSTVSGQKKQLVETAQHSSHVCFRSWQRPLSNNAQKIEQVAVFRCQHSQSLDPAFCTASKSFLVKGRGSIRKSATILIIITGGSAHALTLPPLLAPLDEMGPKTILL